MSNAEETRLAQENAELREALTVWCDQCWSWYQEAHPPPNARPAVVTLAWSDRGPMPLCAEHIPLGVFHIAFDHSYDRYGISPDIEVVTQRSLLGMAPPPQNCREMVRRACEAARAYFDEVAPGWHDKTVDLDSAQEEELMKRLDAAVKAAGESPNEVVT